MIQLGTVGGLKLTADRSAVVGSVVGFIVCAVIASSVITRTTLLDVIMAGLMCTLLHWVSEYIHQFGHALAAAQVGYPMIGVKFYLVLGMSIYPKNEPPLSSNIHIRRALGGPIISVLLCTILAIVSRLFPQDSLMWFVFTFGFLDNLLIFTLGALFPLNFTDGGTILKHVRAQQKRS